MSKEQKTIIQIYISFLIAIICNFIPSTIIQSFGGILFFILIIVIYIYRYRSNEGTLMYSHTYYLIKSFWISSLFLLIGMAGAFFLADHTLINETVNNILNGALLDEDQINTVIMNYLYDNILVFCLMLLPSLIYLTYRVIKGIILAKKEHLILNPKNWF